MDIIIIGGGASGLMAAIAAASVPHNHITILERQARVGRKLLSTGNGRCNLSNGNLSPLHYHGQDPDFVKPSLEAFGLSETLDLFHSLGLLTVQEPNGKIYPWSDQAGSVLDVLRFAIQKPNITLRTAFEVRKVQKSPEGFRVVGAEETLTAQKLIIACGGLAGTALGGSMSGYQLLRSFGHKCSKLHPALVQVKSSYPRCVSLKGIRANCRLWVTKDHKTVIENQGEVQFTQYGLSGPAIFEVSRFLCQEKGDWVCHLDLLPQMEKSALLAHVKQRQAQAPTLEAGDLLTGTIHNRLGRTIVQEAGIGLTVPAASLTEQDLEALVSVTKDLNLTLTELMGMDSAQVTAGGIFTAEFDPTTMESRLCPGLYACGEVLDIDGDCGGFNLQWAWSSGHAAGTNAGKESA